ncbi:DUF3617 domain-containing protein [Duganella phyllosphaerae]|uniref:DUF3617 domain-containing protein n=1 Tax=Duganella phyllosphaerae TaxID=762836 RepID=A0A1E7X476_9BURK|nr:DUF3617 domain-containing protein [Duganella phyllosphaerae]OFA07274.1 hypothetical protein DUPY_13820 [Duganella phyllosphaerae]
MKHIAIMLTALAALSANAQTAPTIKPGTWETSSKVSSADVQTSAALDMAMQQLGNLPPAQKAQMDAFLAKNGVSSPAVSRDGAIAVRACVTPEMAARKELPLNQKGECTSTSTPIASGYDVAFSCKNPASSGRGTVKFVDDKNYTMAMDVSTTATGSQQDVKINSTGRWISSTCPAKP